jgi:hypothetical protein
MTSAACGGTADRIAARILVNVLREGSGIPAKYSSTFLGTIVLFDAERRLREFDFFILANAKASNFKSVHQPMSLCSHQNSRIAFACSIADTFLSSANTGSGTTPSTCTTAMASRGLAFPTLRPKEKSAILIL